MKQTKIRWLARSDMPAVLQIENEQFPAPWTEQEFVDTLRNRRNIGPVADRDGEVCGFCVYRLYNFHLAIENMAVSPRHTRKGIGRLLIEKLQSKLSAERRPSLRGVVADHNLDMQLFLQKLGFRAMKILYGHYDNSDAAAYVFACNYADLPGTRRRATDAAGH